MDPLKGLSSWCQLYALKSPPDTRYDSSAVSTNAYLVELSCVPSLPTHRPESPSRSLTTYNAKQIHPEKRTLPRNNMLLSPARLHVQASAPLQRAITPSVALFWRCHGHHRCYGLHRWCPLHPAALCGHLCRACRASGARLSLFDCQHLERVFVERCLSVEASKHTV